jgi:acyl-[acyl-carrier-protein]-phospholipid O-acyltransferase/long-chain-fatty-acid--[acyl-carrier-protein] ligase
MERWVLGLGGQRLDELAAVIFTRGRTGQPKGVMLTHRNLVATGSSVAKSFDLGPRDRMLSTLGWHRATGYTMGLWAPLSIGMSIVTGGDRCPVDQIGQLCRTAGCNVLSTTPQALQACLSSAQSKDFAGLRLLICSGEKLEPDAAAQFEQRFQIKPLSTYDCTETTSIVSTNLPDKTLEKFTQIGNKPKTAGHPIPGVTCRVVDAATFQSVPCGQQGALVVSGANLMKGYLHQEELAGAVLRDGWFNTGDQATMDEDGFITII